MMNPIAARSVASFYGWKPTLKNWRIFEGLVIQVFGGIPITETTGIIFVCFHCKHTWAYKKYQNFKKSAYELITSRATWSKLGGPGLGSLGL